VHQNRRPPWRKSVCQGRDMLRAVRARTVEVDRPNARTNNTLMLAPPDVTRKITVPTSVGCYLNWSALLTT
jgi:hypothetical protein